MCNRNLHNYIRISILVPLRIDIFATGKHVNHGVEYGLEIFTIFHFYGPKKPLNSPKNRNTVQSKIYTNFLKEKSYRS